MYWLRSYSQFDFVSFILLSCIWILGGWLITTHTFRLRSSERFLNGTATGMVLFITLSNLLANLVELQIAFWLASSLILLGGLLIAWQARRHGKAGSEKFLFLEDLKPWPLFLALAVITFVLLLIGRGLALFDDYLHIPLVSVMAAGDIPPGFYLNPELNFAYHYGLQVFAASMIRVGGFFPWSAWDLTKAFAISLTILLGWLWYFRILGSKTGALFGSILIALSGGIRWVLLFLPLSVLTKISAGIILTNTGADTGIDLIQALSNPWIAEGTGSYSFPFAFYNGIFKPLVFELGASGALPFLTLILILLLAKHKRFTMPGIRSCFTCHIRYNDTKPPINLFY